MKRIAFVCPGQGSQHVGMGRDVCSEFAIARRTFEIAGDGLGLALDRLCFEGPEERLALTENAQPALLTLSVAIGQVLISEGGVRPAIAAGHSLGEWSALVLAGGLDYLEALVAVRNRGRFMQEAVPAGLGAMTALLGAEVEVAEDLCRQASLPAGPPCAEPAAGIVVVANLNGAGQIVVAGHVSAVERLEALARERRIRASRLKVSAPFHSPLMASARERMHAVLAELQVRDPVPPVVSNVDGLPNTSATRIRGLLEEQITAPVRWADCALAVASASDLALEVGPGRTLTGLFRRVAPELPCRATGDVAGVRAVLAEIAR
jgi:[acyl-carrier-protein] S-malonyltransferase